MEAALSGLLWELSATVRELLRAKSPENSPQRIQRLYIQTRVSGLIYSNTGRELHDQL